MTQLCHFDLFSLLLTYLTCKPRLLGGAQHYQEKLKQIQLEHSNAVTEMKGDIASSSSLQMVQHAESELKLNKTIHDLEAEWREKRRNHAAMIRDLMLVRLFEKGNLEVFCLHL